MMSLINKGIAELQQTRWLTISAVKSKDECGLGL